MERPTETGGPLRLAHLTAFDARRLLSQNPRLLVPVGTLIPRGPALPLGCDSLILDHLADDLSARLRMPRTPLIPFGVHSRRDPVAPGSAGLTRKTLHRLMNELIAGWETEAKVREFFILTGHAADAHLEALSTIRAAARVTLIDIYAGLSPDEAAPASLDATLLAGVAPDRIDPAQGDPNPEPGAGAALYARILDRLLGTIGSDG